MTKSNASRRKLSKADLEACIDYLQSPNTGLKSHSDEKQNNLIIAVACIYEYAREIHFTRDSRTEFYQGKICDRIPWREIFKVRGFAKRPWAKLSTKQRVILRNLFAEKDNLSQPLMAYHCLGVLDAFSRRVSCQLDAIKAGAKPDPDSFLEARIQHNCGEEYDHVIFTIDYRKSTEAVEAEFKRWINRKEIQKKFKRHGLDRPGKGLVRFRSRLSDLAAWRLCDAYGVQEVKPLLAKRGQKPRYSRDDDWSEAKKRAMKFLALLVACEFSDLHELIRAETRGPPQVVRLLSNG